MHIENNQKLGRVLREISIFLAGVGVTLYVVGFTSFASRFVGDASPIVLVIVLVLGYISARMLNPKKVA